MTALNSTGPRPTRLAGLIGSVVLLVGLANACQSVDQSPTDTTSSSGSIAPSASASPTVSGPADEALLAVTATRQFVDSVGGEYPKLRPRVARLSGVHVAHETLLQELTGTTPTDPPSAGSVPTSRARAEAGVRAAESRLARTLADLAVSSEDGPTGRALASMSAGTSQIAASTGWPGTRGATESESDSITLSADQTLAVQSVLEREHASLWWYGVLGGRTSAALQPGLIPKLTSGYEAHRRQRDELTAILVNQGVAPAAAEPTYPIDWNLRSAARNVKEVHRIEHDAAASYSWMVSETEGDLRAWAIAALRNAAIRDLVVQGTPENFPGADELADH